MSRNGKTPSAYARKVADRQLRAARRQRKLAEKKRRGA